MAKITAAQQKELSSLARAANRRLERATEGQRKSLEHNIQNYHTREGSRGLVFQQGKAKTESEYRQRMAELKKFMAAKTSTRKGWEELKKENMQKAQESLTDMGYDITDEELATILAEEGGGSSAFYKALENVKAAKGSENNELTPEQVREAIFQRKTDYQATLAAIKARKQE